LIESSLSKLDDKGPFTILKVDIVERKVGKETITEANIETVEEFDGVKNFYTSRKITAGLHNWPKTFSVVKNTELK